MSRQLLAFIFLVVFPSVALTQDRSAEMIGAARAVYPDEAKTTGFGGKVSVLVSLDETGSVINVSDPAGPDWVCPQITRADVLALRRAALDAAKTLKFLPAMMDGAHVPSLMRVSFDFPRSVGDSKEMRLDMAPADKGVVTSDVLAGKALELPKPVYPPAARGVKAKGEVSVLLLIEKDGSVFSAEPASGHPLLQPAARAAACSAKFAPTLLNGEPVRVSGIINYNFVPTSN